MQLNRDDPLEELAPAIDSAWNLIQSNEFVFGKLFQVCNSPIRVCPFLRSFFLLQHLDVFPEVYGSCGSVYVAEKVCD